MKRSSVVVAVTALVGLVLGVALGLKSGTLMTCDGETTNACYSYFGRPFSATTHYAVIVGLCGLGIGLAVGLLIVAVQRRSSHGALSN